MRGVERIVDDSGWSYVMPKLTSEDIEKYDMGTFDLADWTFGTPNAMFIFYKPVEEFSIAEKIIWRIENTLRFMEWYLLFIELDGKPIVKPIRILFTWLRKLFFKLGWKVSIG